SRGACDDALHPTTNLCKRWKRGGMCGVRNVRDFCQRSCSLCNDEENDDSSVQYLGCFSDGIQSELKLMAIHQPVTVHSCVDACRRRRFTYAGMRDGQYCMCGNDYGSHGEVLKRDGCSKRCGGREACGGALENAIYKTGKGFKKEYLDSIEELVLGKQKKNELARKPQQEKRKTFTIPKTRDWNFMDWIRKYEDQRENNIY
ncbi:hypothetical protein QZH41_020107, partial [Actinostola sp. cb2023]